MENYREVVLELENRISTSMPVQNKIDCINELAWIMRNHDRVRALQSCQQAYQMSQIGEFEKHPYHRGMGRALVTQGFIEYLTYHFDDSLKTSIKGLDFLKELPVDQATIDAQIAISWVNLMTGDYSMAYYYAMLSLNTARELGCKDREAFVLNTLGCIHDKTGEHELAIQYHQAGLQTSREIGDLELQMLALNNLSISLTEIGDFQKAYRIGLESIELARKLNLLLDELIIGATVADALTRMQAFKEAEYYLQYCINKITNTQMTKPYIYIMLSMAKLNIEKAYYQEAEPFLIQALEIAENNAFMDDQMVCYRLLSTIYEKMNSPEKELANYRKLYALKEKLILAHNSRKISLLNANHQLELSKRDTERIYQQRLELQNEIEKRKYAENLLEESAIFDPLTNIFNQRHFMFLASNEYQRSYRHNYPLSILMVEIDDFKEINDKHGFMIGDQLLVAIAGIIQACLRSYDYVGRFGEIDFGLMLPETSGVQAVIIAERLKTAICSNQIHIDTFNISVTISIGAAEFPAEKRQDASFTIENLIHLSEQALINAKLAGKNQIHLYQ